MQVHAAIGVPLWGPVHPVLVLNRSHSTLNGAVMPSYSATPSPAVVPFFSVTESFSLSRPTSMPRRDLKPGSQRATAAAGAGGELVVNMTWEAPDQGECGSL